MSSETIWAIIIGMAVLNYAVRFVPIAVVTRLELPAPVMRWLSYIPISVMGALVAGAVLRPHGAMATPLDNPWLWAAGVTALTYHVSRSFLGSTVVGMAAFVALRAIV